MVGVAHRFPLGVATARSAREAKVNVAGRLANMVAGGERGELRELVERFGTAEMGAGE